MINQRLLNRRDDKKSSRFLLIEYAYCFSLFINVEEIFLQTMLK